MRGEGRGYGIEEKVREVGSTAWKAPFKAPLRDWQGDHHTWASSLSSAIGTPATSPSAVRRLMLGTIRCSRVAAHHGAPADAAFFFWRIDEQPAVALTCRDTQCRAQTVYYQCVPRSACKAMCLL